MVKRANPRAIKAAQAYTIEEAAIALGVSIPTIRAWIRQGLPAMMAQRPYLILGAALREFLQERRKTARVSLAKDQFYCLSCKTARKPFGMMVDYKPKNAQTGEFLALCEACEKPCRRWISNSDLPEFRQIFDIYFSEGTPAYNGDGLR